MLICADTQLMIWGIKRECTPGQEDMIERARHVIQTCHDEGRDLIVPSIVVSELLVAFEIGTHGEFLRRLNEMFAIAPFDAASAVQYSRMWIEQKSIVKEALSAGTTKRKIKADYMIAATAVARRCSCLYTDDTDLIKFAAPYIQVERISCVVLPAKQTGIFQDSSPP